MVTSSSTTDSGYAEAAPYQKLAEEKEEGTLRAAPLRAQSSPPESEPSGPLFIPAGDAGGNT